MAQLIGALDQGTTSTRFMVFDLGGKNAEYQTIPTLRRYVVLHQTQAAAEVFSRGEDGEWTYDFIDASGALDMPEVEIAVPLSEIYDDVELAR